MAHSYNKSHRVLAAIWSSSWAFLVMRPLLSSQGVDGFIGCSREAWSTLEPGQGFGDPCERKATEQRMIASCWGQRTRGRSQMMIICYKRSQKDESRGKGGTTSGGQSQNLWGYVESQWQVGRRVLGRGNGLCRGSRQQRGLNLEQKEDSRGHGGRGKWFGAAVSRWHRDHDGDFGFTPNETPLAAALRVAGLGASVQRETLYKKVFCRQMLFLRGNSAN